MRDQSSYAQCFPNLPHVNNIIKNLHRIPLKDMPFGIIAASIITNLDPLDLIKHSKIGLTKAQIDLILAILQDVYHPITTIKFRANGKIILELSRPFIPPTIIQYFLMKDIFIPSPPKPPPNSNFNGCCIHFTSNAPKIIFGREIPKPTEENIDKIRNISGFYSPDISNGFNRKHGLKDVPCYNEFDDTKPPIIRWVSDVTFRHHPESSTPTCNINCQNCTKCHQRQMENGKMSLMYHNDRRINIEDLKECVPIIFECSPTCQCNHNTCNNMVVQNRSKINLIVFRTDVQDKWGVKTLEFIPCGTFVCEYLGRLISSMPEFIAKVSSGANNSTEALHFLDAYHVPANLMLIMDTTKHGNVSSYIQMNVNPNLIPISVCCGNSLECHRIALFAMRDIYPNEELFLHSNNMFNWDKKLKEINK
ncbi:histone-lysine N-methyltransferase EHMT2 [Histomonas meleagridis]|uniref:histone-lysine N-methyltransferase EHMT2 n=1 Tax=Histomonas meleagridis TaxID=135588 RepID=UPI00355A9143|nr:histone-lysine N-methyltransferase EHMT2 [Histomonas meleagridis]KAH0798745.1 histone-lysine N-methyltransferase EHMT2 [Histomonas meleagridis]